jgi:hypothetical protein
MATRALVFLLALAGVAHAQPARAKITIGIFAPSVEFGTAQARLAYIQALGKAIEQATGVKTEAQSYASVTALKKDNVDFAIIDAPCYATNLGWKLLASATIAGATSRPWGLYSSAGDAMQALRGKKLAYVAAGCNDAAFIDNAMLESEIDAGFFSARVAEKDLTGAIADVTSYKTAHAVFAPIGSAKALTKVFDAGAVPNPAFVEVTGRLPVSVSDKVAAAVLGFRGDAIAGWVRPAREPYQALAARFVRSSKSAILANPETVRIDAREVLIDPPTVREPAMVPIRRSFVRPPGERID